MDAATAGLRTGSGEDLDVDGIVHATGEVLAALSRRREGSNRGELTDFSERYDRAARTPYRVLPARSGLLAAELRHAARRIGAAGMITERMQGRLTMAALLLALAGLVAEIAAWQQLQGRTHQSTAAGATARGLPPLATTVGGPLLTSRPPARPPVRPPVTGLERNMPVRPMSQPDPLRTTRRHR